MRLMSKSCPRGFTLIEMLLAVGLIAVLTGIGAPIFARAQTKNDLDMTVAIWVNSLRRAQVLAQANLGDSQWGVKAQSGLITVFKGASFAARDVTYDEDFALPTTISFSGVIEVVMSKLSGYPNTTGTTTIGSNVISDTAAIIINSRGTLSY